MAALSAAEEPIGAHLQAVPQSSLGDTANCSCHLAQSAGVDWEAVGAQRAGQDGGGTGCPNRLGGLLTPSDHQQFLHESS